MKEKLASHFSQISGDNSIAFKFCDGRKIEHKFSPDSTIKVCFACILVHIVNVMPNYSQDMFQFVFLHSQLDGPFTLHTTLPQHRINFSRLTASDLLSDRDQYLRGRTVMVQMTPEIDFDEFLALLDDVRKYQVILVTDCANYYSVGD